MSVKSSWDDTSYADQKGQKGQRSIIVEGGEIAWNNESYEHQAIEGRSRRWSLTVIGSGQPYDLKIIHSPTPLPW